MNNNIVNNIINHLDPSKVQCCKCGRWLNTSDLSYLLVTNKDSTKLEKVIVNQCSNDTCKPQLSIEKIRQPGSRFVGLIGPEISFEIKGD